jgi:subtilisin family serine protease
VQPDTGDAAPPPEQFAIPPELVEHILLGPSDDRRVLQDSPLLGDVWAAYAADPGSVQDLLITPHKEATSAEVAGKISRGLTRIGRSDDREKSAKIAYLQGLVGANLYFDEVLRLLVPLTQWWHQPAIRTGIEAMDDNKLDRLKGVLSPERYRMAANPAARWASEPDRTDYTSLERYIALAGLIYWAGRQRRPVDPGTQKPVKLLPMINAEAALKRYENHLDEIVDGMLKLYQVVMDDSRALAAAEHDRASEEDAEEKINGYIFQVSLNRVATPALERSVPAVKADAVHTLFKVKCKDIVWAVLDCGIHTSHDAFMLVNEPKQGEPPKKPMSRIRKTFDFSRIREIVSNNANDLDGSERAEIAAAAGLSLEDTEAALKKIAADAEAERPVDWGTVEQLITLQNPATPRSLHGTHVAGIIGADGRDQNASGMCPDIRLYDFRVLGKTMADTEFAIIAALQYIRYVNERHSYMTIHGANLSLSIPHNVRNFACGRTPVCNECERLVESGVVVVAAAGNRGYQKFQTNDGVFENYAAFSITDPGNGDGVITVGSTHGNWPQTYGVSFFSSRGPTGDGRLKPDLVAPGERIQSTVLDGWGQESGTSMAAPHVSGAAAMLLARYEELRGQPRRVKRILCDSATDLGRERSFQGHGMLDVLRAFQSI